MKTIETAHFIKRLKPSASGATQKLYHLSEPIAFGFDGSATSDYVVVSAVHMMCSDPETYIFPADETGEILNFLELPGSFRGEMNHEEALSRAGYKVSE